MAGWIALTATGGLLGSQLLVGVIALYNENYVAQRWQQFLIYIGYTVFAFVVNAFANRYVEHLQAYCWILADWLSKSAAVRE